MFRRVPLPIIRSFSLYTQQNQDVPSWSCSQAVSKSVWHIPLLCVQWKTPDDGQRNCPKHVDFYVYWTVHQLDSWIKRDQLDATYFIISLFNAQHVSDVNTSILRSLLLICWVISWVVLFWFDVCCCYVVVWLGWCGISDTTPQCDNNTHRTRTIQPMK